MDFEPCSSFRTNIFSEPQKDISTKNVITKVCKPGSSFRAGDSNFEIELEPGGSMAMMVLSKSLLSCKFHLEDKDGNRTTPEKLNSKNEVIQSGSNVAVISNALHSLFAEYYLLLEE